MGNPYPRSAGLFARGAVASCLSTIVISSIGCGGFSGAIAGAAFEGALLGAGLNAASEGGNWPFEASPRSLELECGAEEFMITVSPDNAILTISEDIVELGRDYTTPKQFRYFRMTRLPQEDDFAVTEKSAEEFSTDWFALHSDELAELTYGDKTTSCIIKSERPASY